MTEQQYRENAINAVNAILVEWKANKQEPAWYQLKYMNHAVTFSKGFEQIIGYAYTVKARMITYPNINWSTKDQFMQALEPFTKAGKLKKSYLKTATKTKVKPTPVKTTDYHSLLMAAAVLSANKHTYLEAVRGAIYLDEELKKALEQERV